MYLMNSLWSWKVSVWGYEAQNILQCSDLLMQPHGVLWRCHKALLLHCESLTMRKKLHRSFAFALGESSWQGG